MKLNNAKSHIFIPAGGDQMSALKRTTHLCIAAHQDDVEIMCYGAIAECYSAENKWFSAVVVTDGGGSPRDGAYAALSNEEMQKIRAREQDDAAAVGRYSAMLQLGYESKAVKSAGSGICAAEIAEIIKICAPEFVFTHNLADKHDTHVGVALRALEALRLLPPEARPRKVYALEVWRGLDWLIDESKTVFDTAAAPEIAAKLLAVFTSQCAGGKRYDLAALGRRLANATFLASHAGDATSSCAYGLDITELLENRDVSGFISRHIDDLRSDVLDRIARVK